MIGLNEAAETLFQDSLFGPDYEPPLRVALLNEGIELTANQRESDYGPPVLNFRCVGLLKNTLRDCARRELAPEEWHAIDMVCLKLARVVTGPPKRDTYVDGAVYFALAGEMALDKLSDVSAS